MIYIFTLAALALALIIESLAIMYTWLWHLVPLGLPPVTLATSTAVLATLIVIGVAARGGAGDHKQLKENLEHNNYEEIAKMAFGWLWPPLLALAFSWLVRP